MGSLLKKCKKENDFIAEDVFIFIKIFQRLFGKYSHKLFLLWMNAIKEKIKFYTEIWNLLTSF